MPKKNTTFMINKKGIENEVFYNKIQGVIGI